MFFFFLMIIWLALISLAGWRSEHFVVCVFSPYNSELLWYLHLLYYLPGTQRIHATGASVSGSASSAHNKPQPQRGQAPQTPTRSSLMGLPPTPGSRLPRKTLGPCRSSGEASVSSEPSEGAKSTQGEHTKLLHCSINAVMCLYRMRQIYEGHLVQTCFRVWSRQGLCVRTHLDIGGEVLLFQAVWPISEFRC